MMEAVKATAGLAMSTFKDGGKKNADAAGIDDDELLTVDAHWKPTPDLKARMMRPIGGG